MKKIINSAAREYQPVETQNLVLDDAPTVNSFNGVTSDAVARAIAGASGEVPQVTESDNGKVLKAIYDAGGPAVEWGEATVDQTYDATSTNAQSGVAVAQAIATIPTVSYTAGDGIQIDNDEVSVKAGTGLSFENGLASKNIQAPVSYDSSSHSYKYSLLGQLDSATVAALKSGPVTLNPLYAFSVMDWGSGVHFAICKKTSYPLLDNVPDLYQHTLIAFDTVYSEQYATYTMSVGDSYTVDFSSLHSSSTGTWSDVEADPTSYYLQLVSFEPGQFPSSAAYASSPVVTPTEPTGDVVTVEIVDPSAPKNIAVSNPLPASTVGDAGKVLTVDAQGAPAWGMLGSVKSIQQVSELPASPDANTLYLIPEA